MGPSDDEPTVPSIAIRGRTTMKRIKRKSRPGTGNDPLNEEFLYPTAQRLLQHCQAVLRLPGASKGADEDVRLALARGLPVYHDIAEVPGVA